MKKILAFILCLTIAFSVTAVAACNKNGDGGKDSSSTTPQSSQTTPSSADKKTDFTVTFKYGINHDKILTKTSYNGAKVSLTSSQLSGFNVAGYKISGYSTEKWKKNGITEDLTVEVLYTPLDKYSVKFLNPDGSVLKQLSVTEGFDVDKAEIPAANAVTVSEGYYFAGWENDNLLTNVTKDVTVKAMQKKATATLKKLAAKPTVDGVKDDGYVLIGSLDHVIGGKAVDEATWKEKSQGIDAQVYACYDGDYIYVYVEVTDSKVVSFGKEYYNAGFDAWQGDNVEMWFKLDGAQYKNSVDAFGYKQYSTIPLHGDKTLFATRLIGDDNLASYKAAGKPVITNATGYVVEMAVPANRVGEDGGLGEKLKAKDYVELLLQLNSAQNIDETSINQAIKDGKAGGVNSSAVSQIWTGRKNSGEFCWAVVLAE